MADIDDDADDTVQPSTGGARAAHAAAAERMKSTPLPGSAAAAIDAASRNAPAAGTGSHPGAGEDAGSHPAGEETDEAADDKAAQPRDKHPEDQPRKLDDASKDAPPSGEETDEAERDAAAFDKLLQRFGGDREALAKAFHENDSKIAELAKQKTDEPPAEGDEPEPEDAPDDDAATLEAASAEVDTKVKEEIAVFVQTDPDCKAWNEAFIENRDRINAILKVEVRNGSAVPVDGELITLERRINHMEALLDSKKVGLERGHVELDEVQREEVQEELRQAKRDRTSLTLERKQLIRDNEDIRSNFNTRRDAAAQQVRQRLSSRATQQRAADSEAQAETAFTKEWDATFARATKGLPQERLAEVRRELRDAAKAVFDAEGDIPKPGPWVERQVAQLKARWDRDAGKTARTQAREQERTTRQPAPRGPAATAQADRTRHGDPREARRSAERRAANLARGARLNQ